MLMKKGLALGVLAASSLGVLATEPTELELLAKLEAFLTQPRTAEWAEELKNSEIAAICPEAPRMAAGLKGTAAKAGSDALPTVTAHGMGDSCFNRGMTTTTEEVGAYTDSYAVCIPTGDTWLSDTLNGFLLDMDSSIDVFAENIRNDTNLAGGFNAIGFSQGNSLIRGYIQKYNDPVVHTHLSVHGTVSGVAAIPDCDPSKFSFCQALASACGALAYNDFVQGFLFQADYYRDPTHVDTDAYRTYSQLAQWNNEGNTVDDTIKANFAKTSTYAMIKAMQDTMVFPNEGEWWGHYETGAFDTILPMNETDWYQNDMFGLKTADKAGKIFFNFTEGNHLDFTMAQLFGWIDLYF